MRLVDKKNITGLVRALPRCTIATQMLALDEVGVSSVVDLGVVGNAAMNDLRLGDHVCVYRLHLLAQRKVPGTHPRTFLAWWVTHLVKRRAVIIEAHTGRRCDTAKAVEFPVLIEMYAEAVEEITRGTRGRAAAVARENGAKSAGKPTFDVTKNRAHVEAVHFDQRVTGKEYRRRLRRLGWSRAMAYRVLGPRGGQ